MSGLTFWGEKLQWKLNGDLTDLQEQVARVKGACYVLSNSQPGEDGPKGHGGREFDVEFIDGPLKGQRVKYNNVWHVGDIPEDYADVLPDNAVFHWNTEPLITPSGELNPKAIK